MLGREGHNRAVLRACLEGRLMPLVGHALFLEYEDVLGRKHLFEKSPLNARERQRLFESFLRISDWVQVYFTWRPSLRDEGDSHILELAVAGGASLIVTHEHPNHSHPP